MKKCVLPIFIMLFSLAARTTEYAHSLSTDSGVSESYKRFKSRFYLNDNELLNLVKQHQAKRTH
jgi:hypothetical protein